MDYGDRGQAMEIIMQRVFSEPPQTPDEGPRESRRALWATRVLGFLGSAVIFWIVLRGVAPIVAAEWGVNWLNNLWIRVAIVAILSLGSAAALSKIEGTIWGKYYVIIGYLLSLGLIIWIVLHLFHYV